MSLPRGPSSTVLIRVTNQPKRILYADIANAAHVSGASAILSGISVVVPRTSIVRIVTALCSFSAVTPHSLATSTSALLLLLTFEPSPSHSNSRLPRTSKPAVIAMTPSTSS